MKRVAGEKNQFFNQQVFELKIKLVNDIKRKEKPKPSRN